MTAREWYPGNDKALTLAYDDGSTLAELATAHGRTIEEIEARLVELGRIPAAHIVQLEIQGPPRSMFELQPSTPPEEKPITTRPAPRPRWGQAALDLD